MLLQKVYELLEKNIRTRKQKDTKTIFPLRSFFAQ